MCSSDLIVTKTPFTTIPGRFAAVAAFFARHRPAPRPKPEPVEPDSFVADTPFEPVTVTADEELEDDIVVKRRKRMALLGWSTALVVGLLMIGGSVAYYMVTNT